MNSFSWQVISMLPVVVSLVVGLAACNPPGSPEPPMPTVVAATLAPSPSPTAAVAATLPPPPLTPVPTQPPRVAAPVEPTVTPAPAEVTDPVNPTAPIPADPNPTEVPSPTVALPQPIAELPAVETPLPEVNPLPTAVSAAAVLPPLDALALRLVPVADGFTKPLYLTHAGDGSGRLFVVEQAGRILIVKNGTVNPAPFLDITSLVGSEASEQGLLGLAFHPNYPDNGFFYLDYTNKEGDTVIARYQVSANPDVADLASGKVLLTFDQPYANHNGGQVAFGPDGYLYIGTGDGGSANDPHNNGQSVNTLLGKILRLDVDNGDPYGAPQDNPFVNQGDARPEIWSYGWRNPWRFSFDRETGDMYVADVGQNQYEEVDFEPAGAAGGLNYGWRLMEGLHCFNPATCDPESLGVVLPVAEYDHSQGCSITGGYVYRGTQFPNLAGLYLYGDYCSGRIWGLRREAGGTWSQAEFLQANATISSFGQDEAGEVYLVNHQGAILQIATE